MHILYIHIIYAYIIYILYMHILYIHIIYVYIIYTYYICIYLYIHIIYVYIYIYILYMYIFLYIHVYLKWIPRRQHKVGLSFVVNLANLCLLFVFFFSSPSRMIMLGMLDLLLPQRSLRLYLLFFQSILFLLFYPQVDCLSSVIFILLMSLSSLFHILLVVSLSSVISIWCVLHIVFLC